MLPPLRTFAERSQELPARSSYLSISSDISYRYQAEGFPLKKENTDVDVITLFTCFTVGYSLGSCFVNGNGVDLRGVSPNSRKVVLARRDSVVRSEVTRFSNKPYSI